MVGSVLCSRVLAGLVVKWLLILFFFFFVFLVRISVDSYLKALCCGSMASIEVTWLEDWELVTAAACRCFSVDESLEFDEGMIWNGTNNTINPWRFPLWFVLFCFFFSFFFFVYLGCFLFTLDHNHNDDFLSFLSDFISLTIGLRHKRIAQLDLILWQRQTPNVLSKYHYWYPSSISLL